MKNGRTECQTAIMYREPNIFGSMKKLTLPLILLLPVTGFSQANPYSRPPVAPRFENNYTSQRVPLPLGAIERALQAKQAQYNASINDCQSQAIDLYNEKDTAPDIEDGKHKVTLLGMGTCAEAIAIVDQGRISSIPLANGSYLTEFTISTKIEGCRSKRGYRDQETGVIRYLDVLFIEDLYKD